MRFKFAEILSHSSHGNLMSPAAVATILGLNFDSPVVLDVVAKAATFLEDITNGVHDAAIGDLTGLFNTPTVHLKGPTMEKWGMVFLNDFMGTLPFLVCHVCSCVYCSCFNIFVSFTSYYIFEMLANTSRIKPRANYACRSQ